MQSLSFPIACLPAVSPLDSKSFFFFFTPITSGQKKVEPVSCFSFVRGLQGELTERGRKMEEHEGQSIKQAVKTHRLPN